MSIEVMIYKVGAKPRSISSLDERMNLMTSIYLVKVISGVAILAAEEIGLPLSQETVDHI